MNFATSETSAQVGNEKYAFHFAWQHHVAARADLSPIFRLIGLRLALFCHVKTGRCDPSRLGLAKGCACSVRTVDRALAKYERLGLLVPERTQGGSGCRNHYRLTLPEGISATTERRQSSDAVANGKQRQGEHETASGEVKNGVSGSQKRRQSSVAQTCEHEVEGGTSYPPSTEHVNMPKEGSDRGDAAAPDGAASLDQTQRRQARQESGARGGAGSAAEREPHRRPIREISLVGWQTFQEDVAAGNVLADELDDGFDYEIIDYDAEQRTGRWCRKLARWTDGRYVLSRMRANTRARGNRARAD